VYPDDLSNTKENTVRGESGKNCGESAKHAAAKLITYTNSGCRRAGKPPAVTTTFRAKRPKTKDYEKKFPRPGTNIEERLS